MLIGLLGDVHGRVLHALAAVATWQRRAGRRFDALIQVGDMGAFPDPGRADEATARYFAADPSEADFSRLLRASGALAGAVEGVRAGLAAPILFVRGNHEDFDYLAGLPIDPAARTAPVDPFGVLRYVPDGTVIEIAGLRAAFLGGAEEFGATPAGIDSAAYDALLNLRPGSIDVLISHQGPYGLGVGYYGDVQGSKMMTALVERLRPALHIAGHRHVLDGPMPAGPGTYLGLNALFASAIHRPELTGMQPGCLAVLDTAGPSLAPVEDAWLGRLTRSFDFVTWYGEPASQRDG